MEEWKYDQKEIYVVPKYYFLDIFSSSTPSRIDEALESLESRVSKE